MVQPREEQLGSITVLDENGDGYVTATEAIVSNVSGIVLSEKTNPPYDPSATGTEGLFWVKADSDLKYSDKENVIGSVEVTKDPGHFLDPAASAEPNVTEPLVARYRKTYSVVMNPGNALSQSYNLPQTINNIDISGQLNYDGQGIIRVNVKLTTNEDSSSKYLEKEFLFGSNNGSWRRNDDTGVDIAAEGGGFTATSEIAGDGSPRIDVSYPSTLDVQRYLIEIDATYLYGSD